MTALTAAQPKDLEASEIDVRLGATWISPDYMPDTLIRRLIGKKLFVLWGV